MSKPQTAQKQEGTVNTFAPLLATLADKYDSAVGAVRDALANRSKAEDAVTGAKADNNAKPFRTLALMFAPVYAQFLPTIPADLRGKKLATYGGRFRRDANAPILAQFPENVRATVRSMLSQIWRGIVHPATQEFAAAWAQGTYTDGLSVTRAVAVASEHDKAHREQKDPAASVTAYVAKLAKDVEGDTALFYARVITALETARKVILAKVNPVAPPVVVPEVQEPAQMVA